MCSVINALAELIEEDPDSANLCFLCPEFHIIVCGLDSIIARRWMNGMLVRNNYTTCLDLEPMYAWSLELAVTTVVLFRYPC